MSAFRALARDPIPPSGIRALTFLILAHPKTAANFSGSSACGYLGGDIPLRHQTPPSESAARTCKPNRSVQA
jgi:hypothetical protein